MKINIKTADRLNMLRTVSAECSHDSCFLKLYPAMLYPKPPAFQLQAHKATVSVWLPFIMRDHTNISPCVHMYTVECIKPVLKKKGQSL